MANCDCISVNLIVEGDFVSINVFPTGEIIGGANQYSGDIGETDLFIEYDIDNMRWIMYVGDDPFFAFFEFTNELCPFGIWAVPFDPQNPNNPTFAETTECFEPVGCGCFRVCVEFSDFNDSDGCVQLTTPTGTLNGFPYWTFLINEFEYQINFGERFAGWLWSSVDPMTSQLNVIGNFATDSPCPPFGNWNITNENFSQLNISECIPDVCVPIEDRTFREFKSIRLPKQFVEQKRGFDECCSCPPMLVLASNDNESWKNDVTSAWIKLSDQIDTVQFVLEKNGQPTNIVLIPVVFPNEPFAFYTTIKWINVLNSHGVGCYTLKINFNISGINGSLIWGVYDLKPFSIENALKTARIRVKYNLKHEIEGINFTGANVEDSFRFYGFIGRRQPNMEIDNLIYQNREMKTVVRENLNQWSIETDPLEECQISKLTDLILLSENEMWISDHNAHNHSYKILDIPTVVDESPEIDYLDKFQRRAILTCLVGDRNKNKRTYFK